jgi:hypothetical protein
MLKITGYKWCWVKRHSWDEYKKRVQMPIYEDLGKGASRDAHWFTLHREEKNLEE